MSFSIFPSLPSERKSLNVCLVGFARYQPHLQACRWESAGRRNDILRPEWRCMGLKVRWILHIGEMTSSCPFRLLLLTSGTHTVWSIRRSQLTADENGGRDAVYLGRADYVEQGGHTSLISFVSLLHILTHVARWNTHHRTFTRNLSLFLFLCGLVHRGEPHTTHAFLEIWDTLSRWLSSFHCTFVIV